MTRFTIGGERTRRPEELSLGRKVWTLATGVRVPRPENRQDPGDRGLPYETEAIADGRGERLEGWHVPGAGRGGLALMFHGYASSKASLLDAAVAVHAMGWDAFLVDFRGSGGSGGRETTVGFFEADDVARALDHARARWPGRPAVLYGVSMGAAAVLRAVAADGVRPDAVILEAPFDRLLHTVRNRFRSLGAPAFPAADLLVFWGGVQGGFNGFRHDPAEYARSVTCPSLLLHGGADARVTEEEARRVFDNLAGEKELVLFPGLAHQSLVRAQPAAWREAVGRFLGGVAGGRGGVRRGGG